MTVMAEHKREDWTYQDLSDAIAGCGGRERWQPEAWGENEVAPGYVAWIEQDTDAESPRNWGDECLFVTNHRKYSIEECSTLMGILRDAENLGHDEEWIERRLRFEPNGLLAYTTFDFGDYGEATMHAYVPKVHAAKLLGQPGEGLSVAEWLRRAQHLPEVAKEHLDAVVANYKRWSDGEVYTLTVCRLEDGECEYLCGIYDDSPWRYVLECAQGLIGEFR